MILNLEFSTFATADSLAIKTVLFFFLAHHCSVAGLLHLVGYMCTNAPEHGVKAMEIYRKLFVVQQMCL